MGCDIHSYAECKVDGKWQSIGLSPFEWRSYDMYAFLADVRNYSAVPPIAPRRGFPDDASDDVRQQYEAWGSDAHSASWLSVKELTDFDYDQLMEDRRVTRGNDGGCTCEPGEGERTTYRKFLMDGFFDDLGRLGKSGAERVVFWFDN
jgi:hypothetical protein